ncbi:hypothetical protein CICLE_v10023648mg [Citrus x clementina]|uniref:Uncharacterized protein n=1 Tax=Citrus clementina TaxID=85681 RepID=V4TL15_CITCL|nr:hypothetical protein CICLE_v10023648mg [Citrus x clementina]
MIGPKVCNRLLERNFNETAADFFKSKLSSIESGCCKPPIASGFQYQNATFWIAPSSCPAQNKLCINSDSCKAGVLMHIKSRSKLRYICFLCLTVFISSDSSCPAL